MNGSISRSWIGTVEFGVHATGAAILFVGIPSRLYMAIDLERSLDVSTKASVSYLGTTLSYPI